jgi:hypothetical protein
MYPSLVFSIRDQESRPDPDDTRGEPGARKAVGGDIAEIRRGRFTLVIDPAPFTLAASRG